MISNLSCVDFIREYFDEIDDSDSFYRKESCQHFIIKMTRLSSNYEFKKYKIAFICKKCEKEELIYLNAREDGYVYTCPNCKNGPITFKYINTLSKETPKPEEKLNKNYEKYSSQNILGRKNKEYRTPNTQENSNQENKGNINNKNGKVKERPYRTPEQQEESNKINISSNINNENKIRYNENSIIKSNEKKIKIKFIYNEGNSQKIEKDFYFLPSESIKDHYEEIKKEFNFDINNFYYNQEEIEIDKSFKENNIIFDGMIEIEKKI